MLDIAWIRDHPDEVKENLKKLNDEAPIDQILQTDERWRTVVAKVEGLRHERNRLSKEIAGMDDKNPARIEEARALGDKIKVLDDSRGEAEADLKDLLLQVPNMPHSSVPVGPDESANVLVRTEGEPREFDFEPLPHWDLGEALGIIDFERGVKLSGTRFYVLKGLAARLQRALISWMLDLHVQEHGYSEIYPPFLVREEIMWGSAQLPKFWDNLYRDAEEDYWLIPTAEVPVTNLYRDEILPPDSLPIRHVAYTPCFRREKFSAGRDTRGIKRGHQFDKVEMYRFSTPEDSYEALEEMVAHAEEVCRRLDIPHRVVEMCTGDLGFIASKKYDVEMWAPGVGEWLEVSSCSNCEAFQARRAQIRFRREPGGKPEHAHTLNGSGLALPRTMIAILENYQEADGSITVPDVLRPYMAGIVAIPVNGTAPYR
ncbi:MAG: serine--tRNA ligase [Anaerolineae bacterium]